MEYWALDVVLVVVYAAQVFTAMFVWNIVNHNGGGEVARLVAAAIFAILMVAL